MRKNAIVSVCAVVCAVALPLEGVSLAQTGAAPEDAQVRARLAAIQAALDARSGGAKAWQHGWTGLGVGVLGLFTTLSATAKPETDDRLDFAFAAGGTLLDTVAHVAGGIDARAADRLHEAPEATPEEARAKLALAESLLREAAQAEESRQSLVTGHLVPDGMAVAVNLVLALGWGHVKGPVVNAAAAIVVNEVRCLTQPTSAVAALRDLPPAAAPAPAAVRWMVVPAASGLAIAGTF
jgi:hypothetical protein